MSRRAQIAMSSGERAEFLEQERIVTCATIGPRGLPHLMPLWYVLRHGELWAWTFAKSQKARNLERDPRATLQVEAGEAYDELRGVMIEASVTLHRELDTVAGVGTEVMARYAPAQPTAAALAAVRAQAPKRVALQFEAARVASWDHRKLGGTH